MINTFVKTYSNRTYKHVTMVRHRGAVIASSGSSRPRLGGTFDNWGGYRLAIGNELTNNRPRLGEVYLIAIYSRALS